jgi:hypothetical protein
MSDEFLYRWPGARHLMSLIELEQRMDQILADQIHHDCTMMDNIMVEVFDTRILRRHSTETATLGKMSVNSVVQKFS